MSLKKKLLGSVLDTFREEIKSINSSIDDCLSHFPFISFSITRLWFRQKNSLTLTEQEKFCMKLYVLLLIVLVLEFSKVLTSFSLEETWMRWLSCHHKQCHQWNGMEHVKARHVTSREIRRRRKKSWECLWLTLEWQSGGGDVSRTREEKDEKESKVMCHYSLEELSLKRSAEIYWSRIQEKLCGQDVMSSQIIPWGGTSKDTVLRSTLQ